MTVSNKSIAAIILEFKNIIRGSYPSFVGQRNVTGLGESIPVFGFHTVQPTEFDKQLQFLKNNNYNTVCADDVYGFIANSKKLPTKAIMLSFDDGRRSVWTTVYPLLKKYGFKAIVFLAPQIVKNNEELGPNLDDVWEKKCGKDAILDCDKGSSPTITWGEAKVMHESGVIDFQSHSLDHRKIPISNKIINFVNPNLIEKYYFEFDIPVMNGVEFGFDDYHRILGAPVYANAPFLKANKMIMDDLDLRAKCIEHVLQNGGRDFFTKKNWFETLSNLIKKSCNGKSNIESVETSREQIKRINLNLKKAKEIIESNLSGKKVLHLAYPWGEGSNVSVECAKGVGYVSNFWTTLPNRSNNLPGDDPYHMVRLKHDFIWRLPGMGRKSLRQISTMKFSRRAKGELDY